MYIFFENGSFYMAFPDCINKQECIEEFKKLSTYINGVKDGWGGYWFENDQLIMQHFAVTGASLLGGGMVPLEERAVIKSDTVFNVTWVENLQSHASGNEDYTLHFIPYSPKPDSTHWLLERKWYKKAHSNSDDLKK